MEWFIAFLIVAPAVFLAATRSSWLVDYTIVVFAFNRFIRRLVDYYINGAFNPFSPISLTELVTAALLLLPAFAQWNRLTAPARRIFYFLFFAVTVGFAVGFLNNQFSAVYSLGQWLSGLGAMAFAATATVPTRTADRWLKTAGWAGVLVAAYGWYQYLTIPPWDAFWVESVGFVGYLGNLKPMEMCVFSTMHERGPCAGFLAWAAIPMILNRRWANVGGWISVVLILSAVVLTTTRTMFIVIALIVILQPMLAKGLGLGRILIFASLFTFVINFGMSQLPGANRLQQRYSTLTNMAEDGSYRGRLDMLRLGIPWVLTHPLGAGFGSSGLGSRVGGATVVLSESGYIQIFAQFGWLGSFAYFTAFALLWAELTRRINAGSRDMFVLCTRTILIACFVFLYVGDIFSGFTIYWLCFGFSLNVVTHPALQWLRQSRILHQTSTTLPELQPAEAKA